MAEIEICSLSIGFFSDASPRRTEHGLPTRTKGAVSASTRCDGADITVARPEVAQSLDDAPSGSGVITDGPGAINRAVKVFKTNCAN